MTRAILLAVVLMAASCTSVEEPKYVAKPKSQAAEQTPTPEPVPQPQEPKPAEAKPLTTEMAKSAEGNDAVHPAGGPQNSAVGFKLEVKDVRAQYRSSDRIKATVALTNLGDKLSDASTVTEITHANSPVYVFLVDLGGKARSKTKDVQEFAREIEGKDGSAYYPPNLAFPEPCGRSKDSDRKPSSIKPGESVTFEIQFKRLDEDRSGPLDVLWAGADGKISPGWYALQVRYGAKAWGLIPGATENLRSNTVEFEVVP